MTGARELLGIDLRALALLRMGLGALVAWDQVHALRNVAVFYSDEGILPRSALLTEFAADSGRYWSLHMLSGTVLFQVVLILLALAAAVALMLGWRSKWALAVTWVMTASLQGRNPGILYGADTVLRVLQFWCLFLPIGAAWSLDARKANLRSDYQHFSLTCLPLLLQVCMIYWFTAALKYGPEWTRDYTAVYYALSADQFTHGLGHWLLQQPRLCQFLTAAVWWLELLAPFTVFIPWGTRYVRCAVVAVMWGMHLGLACCMRIGYFPVVMMLCWLPFLPGWVFASKAEDPIRTRPERMRYSLAGMALVIAVLWLNLSSLAIGLPFPQWLRAGLELVRLDQHWALFAPSPISDDGWLVLDAECYDGAVVDVLRGGLAPTGDRPAQLSAVYPDWKWQKLHACLPFPDYKGMSQRAGEHWVNEWALTQSAPHVPRSWRLWYIKETTLPDYRMKPLERFLLAENKQFVIRDR